MGTYFDPRYEQESIDSGLIARQQEIDIVVQWYFFDPADTRISDLYDEDTSSASREWKGPWPMPVLQATRTQGELEVTDAGSYTVDSVMLVLSYRQAVDAGLQPEPDRSNKHLKDRFVWDGAVWNPSSIVSHNLLGGGGTRSTVIVQATQVRDDEMVNDSQFQRYAEPDYVQPTAGHIPG